ncbi:HlyD family secretion protein [Flexibacter flexilis]|nr:HlyD family secretion protein [Flexibacter flexilis]
MKKEESAGKKSPMLLYGILGVAAVATAGFFYWKQTSGFETTDNAQLDGNIITVKSNVSSYVDKIYFKDNQLVKKGDTLITLNTIELQAKVEQARAALANAKASIKVIGKKASAGFDDAQASEQLVKSNQQAVEAATSNFNLAKEEHERNTQLFAIKGITQQDFTASKNQLEVAKSSLEQAVSRMKSSLATAHGRTASAQSDEAQLGTAEALIEQRKAELVLAEYNLSHAYVTAPCSGIVTKRVVQQGNLVSASQNLCAIVDTQELWVTANLKESQLKSVQVGQPVEIELDAYPNIQLKGTVSSFGGATGAKFSLLPPDNASGNFVKIVQRVPLRIALDNSTAANLPKGVSLMPGLSAFVKIKVQ